MALHALLKVADHCLTLFAMEYFELKIPWVGGGGSSPQERYLIKARELILTTIIELL